jgi:hypothetical protein
MTAKQTKPNPTPKKAPSKHTAVRSPAQREKDLAFVADCYERKLTQAAILVELNAARPYSLTRTTIVRDLAEIRAQWRKLYTTTFNDGLAKELASLDRIEREAWTAFEKSKKPRSEKSSGMEVDTPSAPPPKADVGAPSPRSKKTSGMRQIDRDGDPRWLDLALSCVEKRARILGLFAPERHELFHSDESDEDDRPLGRLEGILVKDLLRQRRKGALPLLVVGGGKANRGN